MAQYSYSRIENEDKILQKGGKVMTKLRTEKLDLEQWQYDEKTDLQLAIKNLPSWPKVIKILRTVN